jgi:hypothetical protein
VNAPGGASLNAADRLVIIDLFGAYAQDCDAGKPGELVFVFTGQEALDAAPGGVGLGRLHLAQEP